MSEIDIDYLREWVGREQVVADDLSPFKARALAAALDYAHLPQPGDALPPAWQWLYFVDTPRASETGVDGHPRRGGFIPPVPLPRRMWAAGDFTIHQPLRLGVPATRHSSIRAIDLKAGKSGTLVFVTLDHTIHQNGECCLSEEQNLVYREMPAANTPLPPGEKSGLVPQWSHTVYPDSVLLFRYSALTYNSHRIHYDRDYCRSEEFYPGLVVHGPLLATLLANSVATNSAPASSSKNISGASTRKLAITRFRFRAQRPTLDDGPLTVNGVRTGDHVELWTTTHEGFTGMVATATVNEIEVAS